PFDGAVRNAVVDGADIGVAIQDENGRIDLNYASRNTLHDLFRAAGAEPALADALADRVIDWRSPKTTRSLDGATAQDYADAGYGWRPRGAPFQSVDELGLVMGMTPALLATVVPALTVYSHSFYFDMRVAPKLALLTIPGMSETEASREIDARDAAADASSMPAQEGHAYTITAQARLGQTLFTRRTTVLVTGDARHPVLFVDWR
ncbi:MAG: general secretion pathway protein GspK, partial [Terriglobia bacterium]